ncbi:MAG: hypothetical protein K2L67_02440 [Clostridia bacterium]|nr:hypothetical protein [Clostridia bacterium]
MGIENIVERIISDAEKSAEDMISAAREKAGEVIAAAEKHAERNRVGTEAELKVKIKSINDGKAATARLDSAKILLAEKRRVIDTVYEKALEKLIALDRRESVLIAERLLNAYAEEGDEIVFAANYKFAQDVAKLSVVAEKKLKIAIKGADVDGGFILRGEKSDKDLSYGALLSLDREAHQAEIAKRFFK